MKRIAIITARSGSKGLPDKNIKELNGKPLLAYSIEAAKESGCFDIIHLSTDSEKYAEIGREYGADLPFLRSPETSSDTASSESVIRFVLSEYEKRGMKFDIFALLQPTSPLREAEDIKECFSILSEEGVSSVVAVTEMDHSPLWSNTLPDNHSLDGFLDKTKNVDRHHLPTYYRINGAMYLSYVDAYTSHDALYGPNSRAYIMPQIRSVDIDTELDFRIAEAIMESQK